MGNTSRLTILVLLAACHGHGHGHGLGSTAATPPVSTAVLSEAAIAIPIATGQTAAWQAALQDLTGPRYAEYDSSRRRFGLTSQTTFLQKTPMGDFALIHLTAADVRAAFHRMSESQDPWDVKWRQLTRQLHGMDFAKGERVTPNVELAYSMDGVESPDGKPFMFVVPLSPDAVPRFRQTAAAVMGDKHADYVAARERLGITREVVCLESSALGTVAVFYWVASDPHASFRALARSTDPFDAWLREQAAQVHPVGLDALATIIDGNVLVAQYPKPATP